MIFQFYAHKPFRTRAAPLPLGLSPILAVLNTRRSGAHRVSFTHFLARYCRHAASMRCVLTSPRAFTATAGLRRVTTAQRGSTVTRASESGTPEGRGSEDQAERQQQQLQQGLPAADHPDMDPHHRKTVEVSQVEVIDSEEGEPGSSSMGTMLGAAGGMAAAGGLAAAAALGAPLAAAAAAVGAVVGAFAGGAVGKEVPRGVDIDSAMEFDQPHVVAAGQEQERQESVDEVVLGGKQDDEVAGRSGGQLGQHEIADVKKEKK